MKKYFKFIVACVLSFSIVLSSSYVFTLCASAYSVGDFVDDTVSVIGNNIHSVIDTVDHGTRVGWDIINRGIDNIGNLIAPSRKTNVPSSTFSDSPSLTSTYNDYTVNYYLCDDNSSTTSLTYNAYNNYNSTYYDYVTNNYYNTSNSYYYDSTYNTYDYTYNDNRVFVTETYNSIIYTYVNPSTRVCDSYICSFTLPSGDSSFNYSPGYCKGLYWIYGVTNYDYEMDNNELIAYWRLDGDLNNEVPSSPLRLNYSAVEYGDGKFGYALRCNGPFDMSITPSDSDSLLPSEFTLCTWYFNGDPYYKAVSQGWHYVCWVFTPFADTKRLLFIDGIQSATTDDFSQVAFDYYNSFSATRSYSTYYINLPYYSNGSVISAYRPLLDNYVQQGTIARTFAEGIYNITTVPSSFKPFDSMRSYSSTYSGYGMNCPAPLHYPPLVSDSAIDFLYTGTSDNSLIGARYTNASGNSWVEIQNPNANTKFSPHKFFLDDRVIFIGDSYTTLFDSTLSSSVNHNSEGFIDEFPSFSPDVVGYDRNSIFDSYDLSNCYWDEIRAYSGTRLDLCQNIQVSRQELEVGYIAPSTFSQPNGIGVQSTVPVNQFRIGGVIPTVTHEGDVWFKIDNGFCTSCVQFYSGAWHEVNFGVFDGETWRNGYTYNFYNLSFDANDYDNGTVPSSVINYYYGDTYNVYNDYFKDNQSEKENAISWWTSLIGLISGAFTAIVPFLTGYLGFLPVWLTVPFLTFIPILLILLIVKIKDIFK